MIFKTREHYISQHGTKRYGIVDYILNKVQEGLNDKEIQGEMLRCNIVPSPQMLDHYWRHYKNIKDKVQWQK